MCLIPWVITDYFYPKEILYVVSESKVTEV